MGKKKYLFITGSPSGVLKAALEWAINFEDESPEGTDIDRLLDKIKRAQRVGVETLPIGPKDVALVKWVFDKWRSFNDYVYDEPESTFSASMGGSVKDRMSFLKSYLEDEEE